MIEVTGKMPTLIKNKLSNAGILSDGLITGGNDIDLTFNSKGTETHLVATFVGNGKWVVDEIDDNINIFPQIEEGDSISADMITKLFIDSINSGLHNGYIMEYDYDHYDILSMLSKYADYKQNGLDSAGNPVYEIMWKKLYDENECKDYAEGMEEIYDVNFSEDLSKMYISKDVPKDLFEESNVINSDLILSFNPLGKVKYGIQDVGKAVGRAVKKVGKGIVDWAADRLDADQAEQFIRTHGPYRRKYFDTRDDKIKEKKDFNGKNINVGKIEKLPGMGHWKVLTGNPDTQDFQVWHLYRNGAKIRVLDLRTNLQAQEAQWAFDNNIPKSWSPGDWQSADGQQQKANEIPLNQIGEEQTQTEEDNVTETKEQNTEQILQEEDNVTESSQDTQSEEVPQEEEDNIHDFVVDYYKDNDDEDGEANIMNSLDKEENNIIEFSTSQGGEIEGPDATESEPDVEEDNVIDSGKKKKKSKYNGMNVTGCAQPDGTVVMASIEEDNRYELIFCSLLLNNLTNFKEELQNYSLGEKSRKVLSAILLRLNQLPFREVEAITESSNKNILIINFGKTNLTSENYIAQFSIYSDEVMAIANLGGNNKVEGDGAIDMCTQTLDDMIRIYHQYRHQNQPNPQP